MPRDENLAVFGGMVGKHFVRKPVALINIVHGSIPLGFLR
jgi:hypothetical protein